MPHLARVALVAAGLVALAGPAISETRACAGDLTVARLSDPVCIVRIAIPTPRPDPAERVADTQDTTDKQARLANIAYVDAPTADGQVRRIRLIGPQYMPDEKIDLHRPVTMSSDPVNAAFQSVASLFIQRAGHTHGAASQTVAHAAAQPVQAASHTALDSPILEARLAAR